MNGRVGWVEDGGSRQWESGKYSVSIQNAKNSDKIRYLSSWGATKKGRGGGGCMEGASQLCSAAAVNRRLGWEEGGAALWPSPRLTQKLIEILSVFCNDVLFVMGVEHRPRLKLTRNQSQDEAEGAECGSGWWRSCI